MKPLLRLTACAVVLCASRSHAVPSPANSSIPAHMLLVGRAGDLADTTYGAFTVVVRDAANNPVANSTVEVRILNCPGARLSSDSYDPPSTIRCGTAGVLQTTNALGEARIALVGGGTPRQPARNGPLRPGLRQRRHPGHRQPRLPRPGRQRRPGNERHLTLARRFRPRRTHRPQRLRRRLPTRRQRPEPVAWNLGRRPLHPERHQLLPIAVVPRRPHAAPAARSAGRAGVAAQRRTRRAGRAQRRPLGEGDAPPHAAIS